MKIKWMLLVLCLAACAAPATATPAGPAQLTAPFPPAGPVGSTAKVYQLESGWHNGQAVRYYNFGSNTPLDLDDPTRVAIASGWAFVTSVNADGSPNKVEGQFTVFDVKPGDPDYSDMWQIHFVTPPADYQPQSITSAEALEASGYPIEKTPLVLNCPIVATGSSLVDNALPLQKSWVRGEQFDYFDFGPTNPTPRKVYAFVTGFTANDEPQLVPGQHFIFDSKRGDSGYSDFWSVHWVTVDASYVADSIRSVADIPAEKITPTQLVVNYPQK